MAVRLYSNPYWIYNIPHSTPALNHFRFSQSWMNRLGFLCYVFFLHNMQNCQTSHICVSVRLRHYKPEHGHVFVPWRTALHKMLIRNTNGLNACLRIPAVLLVDAWIPLFLLQPWLASYRNIEWNGKAWCIALSSWKHEEIKVQIYSKQACIGQIMHHAAEM